MSVDYNDKLGQAVKQARVQSHMTQEQLAEILNISATHLKSIERGERYPSFKLLEKLVRELSLSLDTIFLCGHEYTESMVMEIQNMLRHCSQEQLEMLSAMINGLLRGR